MRGYVTLTFPISFSNIYIATSSIYSGRNSYGDLGWHGIGIFSNTTINVTWNTYENRSPVAYVGYIAIGK